MTQIVKDVFVQETEIVSTIVNQIVQEIMYSTDIEEKHYSEVVKEILHDLEDFGSGKDGCNTMSWSTFRLIQLTRKFFDGIGLY